MNSLRIFVKDTLRNTEKYTKTDATYVFRGGFWLGIGAGISTLITLGLAVAFSHLVPKEVYGNYKYLLSLADILGAFTLTGISTAVLRAAAKKFDGSLKQGLFISLRWSLPMVLLALVGSAYYFYNNNITLGGGLLLIATFSPIISSTGLYNSFAQGRALFDKQALFVIFRTGIPAIALLITILYTSSALLIVAAFFISHAVTTSVLYLITSRTLVRNQKTSPDTLSFGKHFSIINIVNTVSSQIDKIFVFQFMGGTELAIYAFATLVPQHISGLFNNLSTLAFPKFAQKRLPELVSGITQKTWRLSFILVGTIGIYVVMAPYLYNFFFPAYAEAAIYSQVGIFILVGVSTIFASTALKAEGAVKELHTITISISIIKILILIPAILWFGLWGAIYATVISKVFKTLLTFYFFSKAKERIMQRDA